MQGGVGVSNFEMKDDLDLVIALDKSEEEEFHLSRRTQYYPETYQIFYCPSSINNGILYRFILVKISDEFW